MRKKEDSSSCWMPYRMSLAAVIPGPKQHTYTDHRSVRYHLPRAVHIYPGSEAQIG